MLGNDDVALRLRMAAAGLKCHLPGQLPEDADDSSFATQPTSGSPLRLSQRLQAHGRMHGSSTADSIDKQWLT